MSINWTEEIVELNELKALMAANIIAGRMAGVTYGLKISEVTDDIVAKSVRLAQKIWEEVLRQERED